LLVTTVSAIQVQYWERPKWGGQVRATKTGNNLLLLKTKCRRAMEARPLARALAGRRFRVCILLHLAGR
jgi:hypothetical protein